MSIAASTRTGGTATGTARSVADPPNKRREVRRLPDLSWSRNSLLGLVVGRAAVGVAAAVGVRVRVGRSRGAGNTRLELPRLAVLRCGRIAREAGTGALRLRVRLRILRVDRQAGEIDHQGAEPVGVVDRDAGR